MFAQNDIQNAGDNRKDFTLYNAGNDDSKKDKKQKKDKKDRKPRDDDGDAAPAAAQAENASAANVSSASAANRSVETLWNWTPPSEHFPGSINREGMFNMALVRETQHLHPTAYETGF